MNCFFKFFFIFLIGLAIPVYAEFSFSKVRQNLAARYKSYDMKSLPKDLVQIYLVSAVITLTHEIGHAIGAKVLLKAEPEIHFGSRWGVEKPLIKLPGIAIDTLNPVIGHCDYTQADQALEKQRWRKIIIYLAGPLAGAAIALMLSKKFKATDYFVLNAICSGAVVGQLIGNLVPYNGENDGSLILQELRKS